MGASLISIPADLVTDCSASVSQRQVAQPREGQEEEKHD